MPSFLHGLENIYKRLRVIITRSKSYQSSSKSLLYLRLEDKSHDNIFDSFRRFEHVFISVHVNMDFSSHVSTKRNQYDGRCLSSTRG